MDNQEQHVLLDPGLRMGLVSLRVSDLTRSVRFYETELGLRTHETHDSFAALGPAGQSAEILVTLQEETGASAKPPGTTGLYHYAILLPERRDLARALRQLLDQETPLQGASDHLVSEAVYLADPDGNGIELYCDRPRSEWQFGGADLRMATLPLDVPGLLAQASHDEDTFVMPGGTRIGHVHLHVSDLDRAEAFYSTVIGFDVMMRYGSQASFLSQSGYHHHLGLNTWAGRGAPPPPPEAVGLLEFRLCLSSAAALERLARRLQEWDVPFERSPSTLATQDPSGNRLRAYLQS